MPERPPALKGCHVSILVSSWIHSSTLQGQPTVSVLRFEIDALSQFGLESSVNLHACLHHALLDLVENLNSNCVEDVFLWCFALRLSSGVTSKTCLYQKSPSETANFVACLSKVELDTIALQTLNKEPSFLPLF
jgi:hypothetical protein